MWMNGVCVFAGGGVCRILEGNSWFLEFCFLVKTGKYFGTISDLFQRGMHFFLEIPIEY